MHRRRLIFAGLGAVPNTEIRAASAALPHRNAPDVDAARVDAMERQ
jgi:hypothetical protein